MTWLVRPRPSPDPHMRLFCFPYAGGGTTAFRPWADMLPAQVELCCVQLPGREWRMREEPHRKMDELVAALSEVLAPELDVPFALFGHSMGALIGFELCRDLRRAAGPRPERLFVSAHPAPQLPARTERTTEGSDEEFVRTLRRLDGTPAEVLDNPELMALLLPALRADFELCENYPYTDEPPLDVPITGLCGLEDPVSPSERMEPWAEQTTAGFALRTVPGGHFFVHDVPELVLRVVVGDMLR